MSLARSIKSILRFCTTSSTNFETAKTKNQRSRDAMADPQEEDEAFQPCLLFFYGSLMDTDVLRMVARLDDPPVLQDASIEGFNMKMWGGTYPTVLPQPEGESTNKIVGKAWKATAAKQIRHLQHYETGAYKISKCKIQIDGGEVVDGFTFCWSGAYGDNELEEGTFDLGVYQTSVKPHMFGN